VDHFKYFVVYFSLKAVQK